MIEQMKKIDLKGVTYARAVEEAKRLHGVVDNAWIELCWYLRAIENSGLWQHGPESFAHWDDFMYATFPASFGPTAYRNRLAAIEGYGADVARHIAPEATHAVVREAILKNPAKRQQMSDAVMDHFKTHGVKPSARVVRTMARELTRDVEPARPNHRLASVDENRALRSKLAVAEAEITKLREKVKALQKELRTLRREAA